MNWLDAQLTLVWIRLNIATEGNGLMAMVLNHGETSFLGVKLIIGAGAAYLLYRCAHIPLARRGMTLVLAVYVAVMVVHTATGFCALGWEGPIVVLGYFGNIPAAFLALLT
ncbi:MAG TPA: DUF5658 family protein [Pyrinomonadaceae bacterium]